MSLEPGSSLLGPSPGSSGRSTPVARQSHAQAEDETLRKDKSYRRFASGVERALSLFETALHEWADYISFLGRLLKALQAHPQNIKAVPFKATVANRLAQCLNPSLPSGVHQKSLEVYTYIFSMIGQEALSRDLHVYLPGLTPTLSFASLSVRPAYLSLLESHVLSTHSSALRPALRAILLALLPGLEEETSEEFERTLSIVDGFKNAVNKTRIDGGIGEEGRGDEYFWQCFFLATITSPSRRQGALAYLVRRLPRLGTTHPSLSSPRLGDSEHSPTLASSVEAVVSPEPGLLIRCFAAGLADDQLLIQRGFLDLLVTHCPLHSAVLQHRVTVRDLELLISAAAGVVTRKDMSLNRRLWTWILGPELPPSADAELVPSASASPTGGPVTPGASSSLHRTQYFESFGLHHLISAILRMFEVDATHPTDRARPFRICLSLMDRWEVGGLVLPAILLPALDSVRGFEMIAASRDQFGEVVRSASVFFDGIESGLIWGKILDVLEKGMHSSSNNVKSRVEKLELVKFVINHFNTREEEMLIIHIPTVAFALLAMIEDEDRVHADDDSASNGVSQGTDLALSIAESLLDSVPERAFLRGLAGGTSTPLEPQDVQRLSQREEIMTKIYAFYRRDQGNLDLASPPIATENFGELLLHESSNILCTSLAQTPSQRDLEVRTRPLIILLRKIPSISMSLVTDVLSAIHSAVSQVSLLPFPTLSALVSVISTLQARVGVAFESASWVLLEEIAHQIVRHAWQYLSPSQPKYHVELVRCLWHLQAALESNGHCIEAAICALMVEDRAQAPRSGESALPARRFAILWTHTMSLPGAMSDTNSTSKQQPIQDLDGRATISHGYDVMLSRPLLHILDDLTSDGSEHSIYARSWLQNLPSIDRVFHVVIRKLLGFSYLDPKPDIVSDLDAEDGRLGGPSNHDIDSCLYYFRLLSDILSCSTGRTWATLANDAFPTDEWDARLLKSRGFEDELVLQNLLVQLCMRALRHRSTTHQLAESQPGAFRLYRLVLKVLLEILNNPYAAPLGGLELDIPLLDELFALLQFPDPFGQAALLDVVLAALKLRLARNIPQAVMTHARTASRETTLTSRLSFSTDPAEKTQGSQGPTNPPPQLLKCLQRAFSSTSSRPILDSWSAFLANCLPLYSETIFQVLIPLVESLCVQISETFEDLKSTFGIAPTHIDIAPETSLIALLNGLEQVLATAHDRLIMDEMQVASVKTPEQAQGFFGNMVSGVFATDGPETRKATANDRLTVLLSFKDSVRICFTVWSWGGDGSSTFKQDPSSQASLAYTSLRTRNRARRLLEHLFAAETLECLETLVEIWRQFVARQDGPGTKSIFNILHVLDGSRPKNTVPAIFNAMYSRTNPTALDLNSKSTLASDLTDLEIVAFLVEYARSLDDDALDEIWTDCMTFLRDVLANPFPHRQTLPKLLEFAAVLGEKLNNTNFGEQRRMRRELSDVFVRLLAAMFTTKPMGFSQDVSQPPAEKAESERGDASSTQVPARPDDVVAILGEIVPSLPKILSESDRVLGAATSISTGVISPAFKAKAFPENLSKGVRDLLTQIARLPNAQKSWRKDIGEAFNHPRFFSMPMTLVESSWLALLRQWTLGDKDRLPELLSRLTPPTTAGIVFGVGASSARADADRKTQLNLRRIALLIFAAMDDAFVINLAVIEDKIAELLTSTAASSPSSATRAEVYMLLRTLVLKTSPVHLAPLWPIINAELQMALASALPGEESDSYGVLPLLQACKLLDTLLVVAPEGFQLHEWLYITDTIDAVYRPTDWLPSALADELSEGLGSLATPQHHDHHGPGGSKGSGAVRGSRRPLLGSTTRDTPRADLLHKVLRPFFSQLSIHAFESTYSMDAPDLAACGEALLADLFDEATVVGS